MYKSKAGVNKLYFGEAKNVVFFTFNKGYNKEYVTESEVFSIWSFIEKVC